MSWLVENWGNILTALSAVIAAAAAVTALTPTPKDDTIVRKARKVLDVLALNVGKAKNRDG